jgi:hypothetical protein
VRGMIGDDVQRIEAWVCIGVRLTAE